jgi:HNH endonuclease
MENKEYNIQKFMKWIHKTDSCWLWTGCKHLFGYGQIWLNKKRYDAHRASWLLFKGEIPEKTSVCHNCPGGDNPSCCNPEHLLRDSFKKKRGNPPKGERSRTAKLTKDKVIEMKRLRKKGMYYEDIAKLYGVSSSTAQYAIKGQTWTDLIKECKK